MEHGRDLILIIIILQGFVFLGSSRLPFAVRTLGLQGVLLGLLPLVEGSHSSLGRVAALAAVNVAVKGVLLPRLLNRAARRVEAPRAGEPSAGFGGSLVTGIVGLGFAFWLAARLAWLGDIHSTVAVAAAFFNMFVGFFVIISPRGALTQALGYLVMENGVYLFGVALALDTPLLVELGVLLDLLAAVFVMGLMMFQISRTSDDIDVDRLLAPKE